MGTHHRILRGDLPELASLLLLCEDKPTEETLRRQRELLAGSRIPEDVRAALLAVAFMIGGRFFPRDLLERVFRQELPMLKQGTIIDDWIEEGVERGRAEEAREILLELLRARFGELPPLIVQRIGRADPAWCREMVKKAAHADSLQELGF